MVMPIPGLLQIILKECHEIVKMPRAPLVTLLPDRRNQPVFPSEQHTALIRSSSHSLACSEHVYVCFYSYCCRETAKPARGCWSPQKKTSLHVTDHRESSVSSRLRFNYAIQTDGNCHRSVSSRQTLVTPGGIWVTEV